MATQVYRLKVVDLWVCYDPVEVPHYSGKCFNMFMYMYYAQSVLMGNIKNIEIVKQRTFLVVYERMLVQCKKV